MRYREILEACWDGYKRVSGTKKYAPGSCEKISEDEGKSCPVPTQNLKLNTKNRDSAIQADHIQYGPLNVDEPGDYWKDIADFWSTTEKAAKISLCGNCSAFDISPRMLECMPGETSDEDGELGYCWMHHFKCHSARSCRTWAKGGPITEDEVSLDWQSRNLTEKELEESLKDWFGKGKKGGAGGGGWDAYNSKGERIGKCGDTKGSAKPKCLSKSKAASLRNADKNNDGKKDGKAGIARAVNRKRKNDPNKSRTGKAKNVKN